MESVSMRESMRPVSALEFSILSAELTRKLMRTCVDCAVQRPPLLTEVHVPQLVAPVLEFTSPSVELMERPTETAAELLVRT